MFPAEKRQNVPDDAPPQPSKSERKRAMHELQALGERLLEVDSERLAELGLPERLVDAIAQARGITRHEARRRQLQFIGKLMRDVDPEPLKAALIQWHSGPNRERARFARLEQWRDRLLTEPDGLARFLEAYPEADRIALSNLIDEAHSERKRGQPPHKSRALFRAIAKIVEAGQLRGATDDSLNI